MLSKSSLSAELKFYNMLHRQFAAKLKGLPEGHLYFKQEHGTKRPYVYINGKEKYLKRNSPILAGLLERFELEKSQNYLDRNITALKDFLEIFTDLNDILPGDYMLSGGKLSKDQISAIAAKWEKQRKIEHLPAELFVSGSDDKPRKYRTSDGTYVKSKSELFIYEYLKLNGIPFLYENPTSINGKVFYPDFTIMRPSDGKIILWEHFGMMGLEGYRNQTQQKLFDYSCEGYWPFKNLITTFEFRDGDLDVSEIERILVMMEIISR